MFKFKDGSDLGDVTTYILGTRFLNHSDQVVYAFEDYRVVINQDGYFVIGNRTINYLTLPIFNTSIIPVDTSIPSGNPKDVFNTYALEDNTVYYLVNIGTIDEEGGAYIFKHMDSALDFVSMYLHLKTLALESKYLTLQPKDEDIGISQETIEEFTNLYWFNYMLGLTTTSPFYRGETNEF